MPYTDTERGVIAAYATAIAAVLFMLSRLIDLSQNIGTLGFFDTDFLVTTISTGQGNWTSGALVIASALLFATYCDREKKATKVLLVGIAIIAGVMFVSSVISTFATIGDLIYYSIRPGNDYGVLNPKVVGVAFTPLITLLFSFGTLVLIWRNRKSANPNAESSSAD